MNPLLKKLFTKTKSHRTDSDLGHSMGYTRVGDVFYAGRGTHDDYENVYGSVRPIASRFSNIHPYAIDKNGKTVENVPAVDALYRPNQQFGHTQFFDSIAVGVLTQPELYVLVWHRKGNAVFPGGKITKDNIAGYTFIQGASKINTFGDITYQVTNSKGEVHTYTDKEVITITDSRRPGDLTTGYSPTQAAKKWIDIEDYIADYQQGFFVNGAVPAGQFIITAATKKEFEDIVDMLKQRNKGADKNNGVTYVSRPVDQNSNKPAAAQIEWVPFNTQNKDMELGTLFDNTNKAKDSAFGVPGLIRGADSTVNRATAQVIEKGFVVNKLNPFTNNVWSQWTHELNRITGGLGVAITYDLEIPSITDEEKIDAERKNLEAKLITEMTAAGYSLNSIVDAFELSNGYKLLVEKKEAAVIQNDQPEVDEGNEVDSSPDSRLVTRSVKSAKAVSDEDKLYTAAKKYMQAQVDRSVSEYLAETKATKQVEPEPTQQEIDAFVIAMMITIASILSLSGNAEYAVGAELAGLNLAELQGYTLTDASRAAYTDYLKRVGVSYGKDTAEAVRNVLAQADELGFTRPETEAALKNIMNTDEWRIKRLARSELNNSMNTGKLEGMKSLAKETNTSWEKTIDHSGGMPCPLCRSQEGVWTDLGEPLWDLGASIDVEDDGVQIIYVNDWQSNLAQDYHPNGRGVLVFRSKS